MPDYQRVNMDIDRGLWRRAKKSAIDCGLSLRDWVTGAIEEKLQNAADVREEKTVPARLSGKE